jgi:hypothetical protein
MSQPPFQPPPQQQPMQQTPQPPPMQGKTPKQKRFGFLAMAVTALISLGVGGAVTGTGDGTTAALPAPTVTETVTEPPVEGDAEPAPTVTVTEKAEPEAKPEPKGLGEGTYQIGTDAKPGRYKTTVPGDSPNCYWERTKDDSGEFGSIIANDNANPGARVSVTLKKGEFFSSNGCGTWVRQ